MGYRSDVAIAITKEEYVKAVLRQDFPDALKEEQYVEQAGVLYWFLEGWKWYDSFTDIKEIDDFLQKLEEVETEDNEYIYGFMRMGEADDDFEERGDPYSFDIHFVRTMSVPGHTF